PKTDLLIERDGKEMAFTVYPTLEEHEKIRQLGMIYATSLKIDSVMENSPALLAGLQQGDEVLKVNGERVYHRSVLGMAIRDNPEAPIELTLLRRNEQVTVSVIPEQVVYNTAGETTPMIGIRWLREVHTRHTNPVDQVFEAVETTLKVLGALIHPKSNIGISNLSGPVGIGYAIYITSLFSFFEVLSLIVLINVNLAILNLLPIPVLDGGHMAFATIAKLRRKPIPVNVIAASQATFMLLFLAIAIYVTVFDFGRVSRNESAITDQEQSAKQMIEIKFKGTQAPEEPNQ
ncbi:MAG: M50 family metallopeptidase, partial [Synechococcaceae cyanobacterium]|nr:M50 family metallopeptidase [Synechococcaceae cyanobacterium]